MSLLSTLSNINPWAVLVAGIAHMATGLVWFSPGIFGREWVELTKQEFKPDRRWIPAGIIGHQVIALALAAIVYLANATSIVDGFIVGAFLWAGFVVTLEIGELIWEKIPVKLFMIRIGNHFLALGIAGAILAVWR